MIKSFIMSIVFTVSVFALSGQEVYENKCATCHQMKGVMDMSEMKAMRAKMQNASTEEKAQMKAEMQKKMNEKEMKAPPMNMVSLRVKKSYDSKEEFIAFVKDYIQNPSERKGVCMPMAYKRFGVMPPIGKTMNEAEREAVALWMHDTFKGSWDNSKEAKTCGKNNARSKCDGKKCENKVVSTGKAESKSTKE